MENDSIQGDEWDAYVTLDTFSTNGTRDRLQDTRPRARDPPKTLSSGLRGGQTDQAVSCLPVVARRAKVEGRLAQHSPHPVRGPVGMVSPQQGRQGGGLRSRGGSAGEALQPRRLDIWETVAGGCEHAT